MDEYNTKLAIEAQSQYCANNELPNFSPALDGLCYRCGRNIYERLEHKDGSISGITVEQAGKTLITGCPHCHFSFVE